jgi:hypothetical protein
VTIGRSKLLGPRSQNPELLLAMFSVPHSSMLWQGLIKEVYIHTYIESGSWRSRLGIEEGLCLLVYVFDCRRRLVKTRSGWKVMTKFLCIYLFLRPTGLIREARP